MTNFAQLLVAGLALGGIYALVALGFTIVIRSTQVLNFAQGTFVMLGAYICYQLHVVNRVPFALAVIGAILAISLGALVSERVFLHKLVGKPVFTSVMMTLALLYIVQEIVPTVWGAVNLNLGDPWGVSIYTVGSVVIPQKDVWTLGFVVVTMVAFFAFFRFSRYGLAMRACAIDPEAAATNGISAQRISTLAWAISGGVAALGGICLAAGAGNVSPSISDVALAAFPAVVLGGLDSPGGAVLGGLFMGVAETLASGYAPQSLGAGFPAIVPYLLMLVVLLVRPNGFFGTRQVERV